MALFTKFASNIEAMKSKLTVLYFSIWLGGTFWSVSGQFIDAETAPKWYFALFGGTFLCWMYGMSHFRSIPTTKKPHFTDIFLSISLCATALAFHGLLQWSGLWTPQPMFPVCGNFDNPAGIASALAFSLPFSLHYTQSPCTPFRYTALASTLFIACAIIASESWAGILSMGCIFLLYFPMKWPKIGKALTFGLVMLFTASSVFLYHYKKDSADGRLLIWQCTWNMIKERPLYGYGYGGFQANYMDEQAQFFRTHPNSRYAQLADDVKSPFNEYLGVLTEFGFIGGTAMLLCAVVLFRMWRKHPGGSSRPALLCLTAIAVFSLFSYPFRYPHTWILCMGSAFVLVLNGHPALRQTTGCLPFVAALLLTTLSVFALKRMRAEILWCDTANRSLCGMTKDMLPVYKGLYDKLGNEPLFLYNYAAELNVAGRYGESLRICKASSVRMSDYYTRLLQADNCKQLKRYKEAERHLQQASYMCPNRFTPLYELYTIYEAQGDTASMHRTAEAILRKPIKVASPEVRQIIAKMKRFKQIN